MERAIRTVLARATTDLNRVDYRALNADARTQYDTAKRFIQQAEDALTRRNLVFARSLADKALGARGSTGRPIEPILPAFLGFWAAAPRPEPNPQPCTNVNILRLP